MNNEWYCFADKYLFDITYNDQVIINKNTLLSLESDSFKKLITTDTTCNYLNKYLEMNKENKKNGKFTFDFLESINNLYSKRYIIKYNKLDNNKIKILSKEEFIPSKIEKLLILL